MDKQRSADAIVEHVNTLLAQENQLIHGSLDDRNERAILGVVVELLLDIREAMNRLEKTASDPDRIFGPRFDDLPDR